MMRGKDILPPPTISRTGQQKPALPQRPKPPVPAQRPCAPPPLPTRKSSGQSQSPPALPPRKSADIVPRRSGDSCFSVASVSTSSSETGRSNTTSPKHNVRAPGWGECVLPPLPPKKTEGNKTVGVKLGAQIPSSCVLSREKTAMPISPSGRVTELTRVLERDRLGANNPVVYTIKAPPLPSCNGNTLRRDGTVTAPKPPARPKPLRAASGLPVVETRSSSGSLVTAQRKIPPPPPPAATLVKIKESSFATLRTKHDDPLSGLAVSLKPSVNHSPVPPPVPLYSRPDLSKIQATKPCTSNSHVSPVAQSTVCMKCRDFSGPDTHAARFPRQSLPTQDLAWLAMQLTAPFSSATDKARVIFTWLHHNIEYDVVSFFGKNVKNTTPEQTLASGLAVCAGYSGLFETIATHAGLEARTISGHGKGYGYQPAAPGSPLPPFSAGHAWNAVRIDGGRWKLVDPCWGAGNVGGQKYNKRFNPDHFIMPNDEFGLRHYPSDMTQFYRDDGRASISWEEYLLAKGPTGVDEPLDVFSDVKEDHGIGERTFQPISKAISVSTPGPIHFQFGLVCEHWTLSGHSHKSAPYLFMINTYGVDGKGNDFLPFSYIPGSGPGGAGDIWTLDVMDRRTLGIPGQSVSLYALTKFGDRSDARGVTAQEFLRMKGRTSLGWGAISRWDLVA